MITTLRRWLRLRNVQREIRRAEKDLQLAIQYDRNNRDTIDDLRVLLVELEHERALAAADSGSAFRAQVPGRVQRWRTWNV